MFRGVVVLVVAYMVVPLVEHVIVLVGQAGMASLVVRVVVLVICTIGCAAVSHVAMDTTYRTADGVVTEWDDLQRKFGNLPEREAPWRPESYVPRRERDEVVSQEARWAEKERAEEEEEEDVESEDEDAFLKDYRKQRMEEMRQKRVLVAEVVRKVDWREKITERSRSKRVIVHLRDQDRGNEIDRAMSEAVDALVARYPDVGFVHCEAKETVPNFPARNLPAILVYCDGKVETTLAGKSAFGGKKCTAEELAYTLNSAGAFGYSPQKQKEHAEALMKEYLAKMVEARQNKAMGSDQVEEKE